MHKTFTSRHGWEPAHYLRCQQFTYMLWWTDEIEEPHWVFSGSAWGEGYPWYTVGLTNVEEIEKSSKVSSQDFVYV